MSSLILQAHKFPQKPDPILPTHNPLRSHYPLKLPLKSPDLSLNLRFLPCKCPKSNRVRVTPEEGSSELPLNSSKDDEEEGARDAVSRILREEGVSEEDAAEIVSNSPNYVRMLIDSVCELVEASLWDSWKVGRGEGGGEEGQSESLSFKEKIYCMGKDKRDKGFLPFLESAGLSPSGSMHVARYLSSMTLLDVISKVKYVKEMLFSDSDQESLISKNARRMMMHLSIFTDDDIQETLSFFAKMEAKRGGLNMLDIADASFPYLIESFPRLLLLSVESHFEPLAEFLKAVGVPKGRIRCIILSFPPIVFYDIDKDMKPRIQALRKVGVEDKDIGRMLVKYPWILSTSIQENYEKVLNLFDAEKVPKASVDHAIRSWPHLLGCSTSKIKLMVDQFTYLGVRSKKLGQVIASSPQLLLRKPNEFLEVLSYIEELGFDRETIGRILTRCPEIFASSVENTLKKKINLLIEFGIFQNSLPRVIRKYPELLVSDVNSTLLPRMTYLMKIGLSKREVAGMVNRFSPLLGYSVEEVLKPKLEFLVCTMQKPVRDVVEYPRYFSYSLEKRIKPRYWVLKGRNVECSLKDMLGKNDEDFAAEYMGIGGMLVPPITVNDSQ